LKLRLKAVRQVVVDEAVALVPQTETVKLAAGMIVNLRDQQEAI